MDVLAGLLLQRSNVCHVAHDPRRLPRGRLEGPRQDDVRRLVGEAGVLDLAQGRRLTRERQWAVRIREYGEPVLLVARIHGPTEDTGVDLGQELERVLPRPDPVQLAVWALDETVQRHLQRRNELPSRLGRRVGSLSFAGDFFNGHANSFCLQWLSPSTLAREAAIRIGPRTRVALRPSWNRRAQLPRRRRYLSISRRSQSAPKSPPMPRSTMPVMATAVPVPSIGQ